MDRTCPRSRWTQARQVGAALALAMCAMLSWHAQALQDAKAPAAPAPAAEDAQPAVLSFDPPTVEFGPMFVGKTRRATVKVTNTSDGPVTISRTFPGCSCTKASDPPKEPLAPGASFMLDVSLDGGDYGGTRLRKVVNFLIDGRPTEYLWLHGDVQQVISVSPQVVDARKATDGDTLKVTLQSARFVDFTVLGVEPAGIVSFGPEPLTEHELAINVAALKAAGMPTKLTVTTNHPDADIVFVLIRVPPPPAPPKAPSPAPPSAPAPSGPAPPAFPAPPAPPAPAPPPAPPG